MGTKKTDASGNRAASFHRPTKQDTTQSFRQRQFFYVNSMEKYSTTGGGRRVGGPESSRRNLGLKVFRRGAGHLIAVSMADFRWVLLPRYLSRVDVVRMSGICYSFHAVQVHGEISRFCSFSLR